MNRDRRMNVVIVLLIANLLFTAYIGFGIKDEVRSSQRQMNDMRIDMQNNINRVDDAVSNQVQRLLAEQSSGIQELTYELVDFNLEKKSATYRLDVQLKDAARGDEVSLAVQGEFDDLKDVVILEEVGPLSYAATVELPVSDDYSANLIASSPEGQRVLNNDLLRFRLKSEYLDQRVRRVSGSGAYGSRSFEEESVFEVRMIDEEAFGIESIQLDLESSGQVFASYDITDQVFMGKTEREAQENLYASDLYKQSANAHNHAFSETATAMEAVHLDGSDQLFETNYMVYYFYGEYDDFDVIDENDEISFRFTITFKDGYVGQW